MCNERIKRRLLAILLVCCMLAAYMPLLAYAAEGDETDQMQQTVEADKGEDDAETEPSPEPAGTAGETVTDIAEEAVSETIEEQPADGEESVTPETAAEETKEGPKAGDVKEDEKNDPEAKDVKGPAKEPSDDNEKKVAEDPSEETEEDPFADPEHPTAEGKRLLEEERIKAYGTAGLLGEIESPFGRPLLRAIPSGTRVNYTSTVRVYDVPYNDNTRDVRKFNSTVDGISYEGTCAQAGIDALSSGTATATKISNTSREAKMIYHLAYEEGWWNTSDGVNASPDIPGVYSEWYFPRAYVVEAVAQACSMGRDAFVEGYINNGFEEEYFIAIYNWIVSYNISNITVPDGFELYHCDAGSTQDFVLWKYTPSGHITLQKKASETGLPAGYSLAGAQYYVYTDSECKTRAKDTSGNAIVLTTNAQGETGTVTIASGTYYVKEIKAPAYFELDTTVHKVTVSGNTQTVTSTEKPKKAYAYLQKTAAETDNDFVKIAPVNYSLAGAEYDVYDSSTDKPAKDLKGNAVVLKTTASGKSQTVNVMPGTYYAKETKASKGFRLDVSTKDVNVTLSNDPGNPARFTSVEEPAYAPLSFRLKKNDLQGNMGWKKLLGAEYTLKYYPLDPDASAEEIRKAEPARAWVFRTIPKVNDRGEEYAGIDVASDEPLKGSDEFWTENGKRILPLGVFTIEETKAPRGFTLSEKKLYGKVFQPGNGADAKCEMEGTADLDLEYRVDDEEQYPTIKIRKSVPEEVSDKSLAGAVYEVYYEDPLGDKNVKVGELVTDDKGIGRDKDGNDGICSWAEGPEKGNRLPMGRYFAREIIAPPGFTVDALYYANHPDSSVNENGEHIVVARSKEINADTIEYTVGSYDLPHRTVIRKTDIASSEELEGAKLQIIDADGEIIEEWTSTGEEHVILALKDGRYTLREITAPYGYDVAEDIEFEVKDDVIENTVEMQNRPVSVGTTALDDVTKSHQGIFAEHSTIVDKVKVTGLYEGREYVVKGVMMDKTTGEALTDPEGNDVTDESEPFIATGDEMEVEVEFTVDSSKFTTDTVAVVFETLYRTSQVHDEETPVELQKHEEIGDEEQSIHYGGIVATTALDKASKSHNILAAKTVTIVDTVKYENLTPNSEFEIKGTIFDKTTGKLTDITASKRFTPKTADGTVDVEFTFDATEFANHDLVAFETLIINDIEITKHEEQDDDDQTMHVPKIRTTATDVATGYHIAYGGETVRIKDVVEYKNLIPGQQYTMNGTLMNQRTGKPVRDNGDPVTVSKVFTPVEKDGIVEIEFVFNGMDLRGDTVVAFEECTIIKEPVAVHMDINDALQSVQIPKIGTKAALVDKCVEDTVSYENLLPGQYLMRGWLVDKETGEKIEGSEGETMLNVTEGAASGTVTVKLWIDERDKLTGHKIVAFEECYYVVTGKDGTPGEKLVGEHKDIKDGKQTVSIPSGAPKTGDSTFLWLYLGVFAAALGGVLFFVIREYAERRRQAKEDAEIFV